MKKATLLLASMLLALVNCSAQSKFTRTLKSANYRLDWHLAKQTADSGYILLGSAKDTAGSTDVWNIFLAKLNAIGDTVWTNQIAGNSDLHPVNIEETTDGFIILTGVNTYGAGSYDWMLIKTDTAGNFQWAKTYGGIYNDVIRSIKRTSDNGFILCGASGGASDDKVGVVKINSTGDTVWTKDLAYLNISASYTFETSDGGIVILGSINYQDGFMCKLSSSGVLLWTRIVSHDIWHYLIATHAFETNDGSIVVASMPQSAGNISDVCKVDSAGNLVFKKRLKPGTSNFNSFNMCQLSNGRINLVYATASSPYFLLQVVLDSAGNTLDAKSLPGIRVLWSAPELTNDGGVICFDFEGKTTKIDSSFDSECIASIPYTELVEDTFSISAVTLTAGSIPNWTITNPVLTDGGYVFNRVEAPCMPNASICLVTVDPAIQKNLIVWEKNTDTTFVDSYNIYKETAIADSYAKIGTVPVSQYSTFLDSASNPGEQADRYCITPAWHGYEKELLSGHKTIHLTINLGLPPNINLIWSDYIGFSYSSYVIWRGNAAGASIIATLPYGTNSFTDLAPPQNDTLYFIEVVHAPCNPSFRWSGSENDGSGNSQLSSFTSTRSNVVSKGSSIGIEELNGTAGPLSIFPNPSTGSFQIAIPVELIHEKDVGLSIYNSIGGLMLQEKLQVQDGKMKVSMDKEAAGIYYAVLSTSHKVYSGKIVVE